MPSSITTLPSAWIASSPLFSTNVPASMVRSALVWMASSAVSTVKLPDRIVRSPSAVIVNVPTSMVRLPSVSSSLFSAWMPSFPAVTVKSPESSVLAGHAVLFRGDVIHAAFDGQRALGDDAVPDCGRDGQAARSGQRQVGLGEQGGVDVVVVDIRIGPAVCQCVFTLERDGDGGGLFHIERGGIGAC